MNNLNKNWEKILRLEETSSVKRMWDIEGLGLIIEIESLSNEAICPHCGKKSRSLHQNYYSFVRDLPICGKNLWLRVNRRQFKCKHCKKPFGEELNLVQKNKQYTKRMALYIVEQVLLSGNIKRTGELNDLTEEEVSGMVKDIAGKILPEIDISEIERLGIDEIAWSKGKKNYIVVLVNLDTKKPIAFVESRQKEDVSKVLKSWDDRVLSQIKEVSMDLYKAYKSIIEELMPNAEIIADRFHVMKLLNNELDEARKKEKAKLKEIKSKSKQETMQKAISKGKYALLKNEKDLSEAQQEKLTIILEKFPDLAEKHELKEEFKTIFDREDDWYSGILKLADWMKKAENHYQKFLGTLKRWFGEIINYFDKRTTNGVVEGINNKLKVIKRTGYGFRNFDNFKNRCLLEWHFNY